MENPVARQKALSLYKQIRDTHHSVFTELSRLRDVVRASLNLEEICDCIALLKKAEELVKDTRTEISKSYSKLEEVACKLYVLGGQLGEPIRTEWVTASPGSKTLPKIPTYKDNPEAYTKLCKHFGLSDELIQTQAFRPHWPGLVEIVTACEEQMKPLPPGISKDGLLTQYTVTCRWKSGVEPDTLVQV